MDGRGGQYAYSVLSISHSMTSRAFSSGKLQTISTGDEGQTEWSILDCRPRKKRNNLKKRCISAYFVIVPFSFKETRIIKVCINPTWLSLWTDTGRLSTPNIQTADTSEQGFPLSSRIQLENLTTWQTYKQNKHSPGKRVGINKAYPLIVTTRRIAITVINYVTTKFIAKFGIVVGAVKNKTKASNYGSRTFSSFSSLPSLVECYGKKEVKAKVYKNPAWRTWRHTLVVRRLDRSDLSSCRPWNTSPVRPLSFKVTCPWTSREWCPSNWQ